jgi:nucleoside 2-deoxyribosyltransferase
VSHSYGDAAVVEVLRTQLPRSVVPVIFPPIDASPDQFISNVLIEEIQRCDALIYLHGGTSAASFWVAFEIEYAKRLGKPIFAFDLFRSVIELDQRSPLDLDVFASYRGTDFPLVKTATEYLAR